MSRRHSLFAVIAGLCLAVVLMAPPAAAQRTAELFAGFQADSKDPVQIDAKTLEIFEEGKQRISVFSGNVVVTRGETTLRSGALKLFSDLGSKGVKTDAFSRIEATGKVRVTSADQTVSGARAVVDMKKQTITLYDNVVLTQGKSVLTGDRLVVDLRTGRAHLEQKAGGRIRGVFDTGAAPGQ